MRSGTERPRRRSIRLREYDYTSTGAYFVTVCASNQRPLFEDPVLKEIVERTWHGQQERFPSIRLDAFVVMPNHIHFIVWLNPVGATLADASVGASLAGARRAKQTVRTGASPAPTLGQVVGAFKSIVATDWLKWLKQNAPHRSGHVWQCNYYEHVIRNEDELNRIREYIHLNPLNWEFDHENPHRVASHEYQKRWNWLEGNMRAAACADQCFPEGRRCIDE